MFGDAKAYLSQNEEWWMKSEKSVFTHFNFSFITFPWQVFVNIIDRKAAQNKGEEFNQKTGILERELADTDNTFHN